MVPVGTAKWEEGNSIRGASVKRDYKVVVEYAGSKEMTIYQASSPEEAEQAAEREVQDEFKDAEIVGTVASPVTEASDEFTEDDGFIN